MQKGKKINAKALLPFGDDVYSSRLLSGGELDGKPVININDGRLAPRQRTEGAAHEKTEIYYILSCAEGTATYVGEERIETEAGDVIIIPPNTFHWIDNTQSDEIYHILTFWPKQEENGVFHHRQKAWGESFRFTE